MFMLCFMLRHQFPQSNTLDTTVYWCIVIITYALVAARIPNAELYKGHSFRRGGATSLARVGVADSVIKTIGRWKSQAYQLYVDIDLNIMCSAAVQVGKLKAMFGGNDVSSSVLR